MNLNKIYFALLMNLCAEFTCAQVNIPNLSKGVTVGVMVVQDTSTAILSYQYTLQNPPGNSGTIASLLLDISKATGTINFSLDGLPSSDVSTSIASRIGLSSNISILPVAVFKPHNWFIGLSVNNQISWASIDDSFNIDSGSNLSGFILKTRAIPGIRPFEIAPSIDVDSLPDAQFNIEVAGDQAIAKTQTLISSVTIHGITIGPDAPISLDSGSLVNRLIAFKHQSLSMGWISGPGSDGIVNSLDAKLSAAQDSIGRGQNNTAVNQLNAFINELDAQHGKAINDNAYFLLKANAQFIISKLGP